MDYTDGIITKFYLSIGVDNLNSFNMDYITDALGFKLYLDNQHSKLYMSDTIQLLIIDNRLDEQLQLEEFFHMIAKFIIYHIHLRGHHLFNPCDEKQVAHLALHLAMPQHLLDTLDCASDHLVYKLSETFKVTHKMALQRVQQL